MFSGEAANANFIIFGLTRPGFEPTIYRTRGEHANHFTTDAVLNNRDVAQIIDIPTLLKMRRFIVVIYNYTRTYC